MKESAFLADNTAVLEKIKEIRFFRPFSDQDLHSFLEIGKFRQFAPREKIILENNTDRWVYFLLSGKVGVYKKGRKIATLRRTGDIFGEMGVVDQAPRSATIMALNDTVTLGIDGAMLEYKYRQNELAFGFTLFRLFSEILAERLRLTTEENLRLKLELGQQNGTFHGRVVHSSMG